MTNKLTKQEKIKRSLYLLKRVINNQYGIRGTHPGYLLERRAALKEILSRMALENACEK